MRVSYGGYVDVVMCASCFPEKRVCTSQYCCIVYTFCVFTMQFVVLYEMVLLLHEIENVLPSIFGVCIHFKIRVFQWSAVQLCAETALGKGGAKDSCHNLLPAGAACP